MAVNGVNGTTKVEQSQPKGEQRVVEQEEEEMFPSKIDGETMLEAVFGSTIAFNLLPEDTQKSVIEKITDGVSSTKNAIKSGIHTIAEKAREAKKEHPILGMGVLPTAVIALDNLVNGDKE
ncbi:MAG: hypothetical protein ACI4S3_01375 [Candidatus Gastranaerophilaceae bacterium]